MAKSIILDRVAVIAEMARQDLTTEELSRKAGVGRSAVQKARAGGAMWRTTAGHIADALGVPAGVAQAAAAGTGGAPC